jgi:hypothetical protein
VAKPTARTVKLSDLRPDTRNANKGTLRGLAMLDDSLREDGAGRGILLDRNNNIIAGNKTVERAIDDGFEEIIIVPTDGKQLVATQRVDVDLDSPQGRRMGLRDNRVGQVDLDFDPDVLKSLQDDGLDLSKLWDEDELAALLASDTRDISWDDALGGLPSGDKSPFQQMTFTLSDAQAETVKQAIRKAQGGGAFVETGNENSNGNALWRVCDAYLHS